VSWFFLQVLCFFPGKGIRIKVGGIWGFWVKGVPEDESPPSFDTYLHPNVTFVADDRVFSEDGMTKPFKKTECLTAFNAFSFFFSVSYPFFFRGVFPPVFISVYRCVVSKNVFLENPANIQPVFFYLKF